MVHRLPDADGLVETEFSTKKTGIYVANFSLADNCVLSPKGAGGINITLPPGTKLRVPDKIGFKIQGGTVGSGTRNFVVLDWKAGDAQ